MELKLSVIKFKKQKVKEAYYFSHDGNARNDEKLLAVRMKYKWEGYGLFWAIVEKLRESTDYTLSKDYNLIAFDLRTDASMIKSLIEDFGLFVFTEDGKYFYSERLSNSMKFKETKSKKASENALKRWAKNDSYTDVMQTHSDRNAIKRKESKVNESIEVRRKEFLASCEAYNEKYSKETIQNFFHYWSEPNKSNTKMKFELQQTWELSRRLNTWSLREGAYSQNSQFIKQPVQPQAFKMPKTLLF